MADSDLASTTKLVLYVLADYANAMDDVCWPSIATLADKASLCERTVSEHLSLAEQGGWLARWKSRRAGRRWAHGHYRLSLPEHVARQQRDALDYDLAAGDEKAEIEADSGDARIVNKPEADSGNARADWERDSDEGYSRHAATAQEKSYRNQIPTNKPVNRNTSKPSLSQTPSVIEGERVQRVNSEIASTMAHWMFDRLRIDDPDMAKPDFPRWSADIEAMLMLDGRQSDQIAKLFLWTTRDRFWKRVITSPARLRKNWDEARRRRNAALDVEKQRLATPVTSSIPMDRRCAHESDGCRCASSVAIFTGAGASRRGFCLQHAGLYDD